MVLGREVAVLLCRTRHFLGLIWVSIWSARCCRGERMRSISQRVGDSQVHQREATSSGRPSGATGSRHSKFAEVRGGSIAL